MRVVSQDGKIDMPYEMVGIFRFKAEIYFLNRNLTGVIPLDDDVRLATYSTGEKAIKAMEMLREQYLLKTEYQNPYGHSYKVALNKVFQFPQDDEIEV